MRRGLIVVFLVAIFAAAMGVGFVSATRLGPVYLEAALESGLSEALGTQVILESTQLRRGDAWPWVHLEISHATGWPGLSGPGLEVDRIHAEVDLMAWLRGTTPVHQLVLVEPQILLPVLDDGEQDLGSGSEDAVQQWTAGLSNTADWLREELCLLPAIDALGGRLVTAGRSTRGTLEIRDLQGTLACGPEGGQIGVSGTGPSGGRFEADIDLHENVVQATLDLDGIEAAAWASLTKPARLSGKLSGKLSWRSRPKTAHELNIELHGPRLGVRVDPPGEPAWQVELPKPALRLELQATEDTLRLVRGDWNDHGMRIHADGRLALPVRKGSPVRMALAVEDLALDAELRSRIAELPPEVREPIQVVMERLESGQIVQLRAETETTVSGWNELLSGELFGRPGAVGLDLSLAEGTIRVGETDRMEHVTADVSFRGDELTLRSLKADFRSKPLPAIRGQVRGLSHIQSSDEFHCVRPSDVPPLPGFDATRDWLRSRRDESRSPSWQRVRIEADWLAHPALLCTLEQLSAEIAPASSGIHVDIQHAVWAGMPVTARVDFYEGVPDDWHDGQVVADVEVGPPFEAMQPTAPRRIWARGRFDSRSTRIGDIRIRGSSGSFTARGSELALQELEIELAPQGEVRGKLDLELGREGRVLYDGGVMLEGIPIDDLWRSSGLGEVALTGTLHGAIQVSGELLEEHPPLTSARGYFALHARNGMLHRKLPLMLAVTLASDRWSPFGSRDRVAYDAIDLNGRIETGRLRSDVLTIEAPTFRMGASMELGVENPHPLQGVLGIFFFPTLDRMIDRLPLVNRVLLGTNRNLVGAYFTVEGAIAEPRARIIPVKSITAVGPASFVLQDLPGFVWGGIQRIQSVLLPRQARPQPAQNAERKDS
ncbi:MAG: hypothetical protein GY946_34000 [bacterium]|nr:hypothetical protein [bacterium]